MFSRYFTRSGEEAKLKGMSQYYSFGREMTIYSGTVDGQLVSWDEYGRYKMNQIFGDELRHELDLVSFENEVVQDPGVYYMEFKK